MSLLDEIKKRRNNLNLTQQDMQEQIGMSRQQYQRLESNGNPRLDTLELIAAGLNSKICLIPKEKLALVNKILNSDISINDLNENNAVDENPWIDIFGDEDES